MILIAHIGSLADAWRTARFASAACTLYDDLHSGGSWIAGRPAGGEGMVRERW